MFYQHRADRKNKTAHDDDSDDDVIIISSFFSLCFGSTVVTLGKNKTVIVALLKNDLDEATDFTGNTRATMTK